GRTDPAPSTSLPDRQRCWDRCLFPYGPQCLRGCLSVRVSPPESMHRRPPASRSTPTHDEAALLHGWGRAAAKDRVEASGGLLHLHQELGVALGVLHLVQEQLDGLLGVERVQHPTQLPDDVELLARHEDLLLTGAG